MLHRFVSWRTIHIGKIQRCIPIPTKVGMLALLFLLYLSFSLIRFMFYYGEWHIFTSKHYGFSIEYPAHWYESGEYTQGHKNLNDLNVEFINSDELLLLPASIAIRVHHRTISGGTLEDITEWGLEIISMTGGARTISPTIEAYVGVDNYPAFIQVYDRSGSSRVKNVYVMSGDDAYILQMSTSPRKWDEASVIFDRMLASFHLPDSPVTIIP